MLDHFTLAYVQHHMERETGMVKQAKQDFKDVFVYEEENYWKTGYNFKFVQNQSDSQVFIMSHSHLDYKNGVIISPRTQQDDLLVSRSQYVVKVEPGSFKGIYSKPYTGYQRGGQANTPKLVDLQSVEPLMSYYKQHYDRYNLANFNVPLITEDILVDHKMPDDREEVEDEGTAPPVKSGYKPAGQRRPVVKAGAPKTTVPLKAAPGQRGDDLDQIPPYMRERGAALIDEKVERRVREFMEQFRQEIYAELAEQRRQNEEHITYYAQQKLGPIPREKQFIPTQTIPQRPGVKAGPPGTLAGSQAWKGSSLSKSPVRVPAGQPQYQSLNPTYQPPSYVKS